MNLNKPVLTSRVGVMASVGARVRVSVRARIRTWARGYVVYYQVILRSDFYYPLDAVLFYPNTRVEVYVLF